MIQRTRDERLEDIVQMFMSGEKIRTIGAKYGVTYQRVGQILNSVGINGLEVRASRKTRLQAIAPDPVCKWCGQSVPKGTLRQHMSKGAHKYQAMAGSRTPENIVRDAEITADYEQGMKYEELKSKYDLSAPAITHALQWNGIQPHRKSKRGRRTQAEIAVQDKQLIADYLSGTMLMREIGEKYNLTITRVSQILERDGVPTRHGKEGLRAAWAIKKRRGEPWKRERHV